MDFPEPGNPLRPQPGPVRAAARAAAAAGYLGGAVWARRAAHSEGGFRAHHRRQALALFAVLVAVGLLFAVGVALLSLTMVYAREFYGRWHLEAHLLSLCRKLLLAWGVFWLFAIGMALAGGAWDLPLLARIARSPRLLRAAAWCVRGAQALAIAAALLAAHAVTLVRSDPRPAQAYFLYHDTGAFPRWFFALGFYPMARAAAQRFGPGEAVLLPLTRAAAGRALGEGRFVFFAAHGIPSGLLLDKGTLRPEDLGAMPVNPGIEFVYLAGCDSGAQRAGWVEALAPAEVVTFDRLTPTVEHLAWMWLRGPARIRALRDQAPGR